LPQSAAEAPCSAPASAASSASAAAPVAISALRPPIVEHQDGNDAPELVTWLGTIPSPNSQQLGLARVYEFLSGFLDAVSAGCLRGADAWAYATWGSPIYLRQPQWAQRLPRLRKAANPGGELMPWERSCIANVYEL
jgi:hypothetical protein